MIKVKDVKEMSRHVRIVLLQPQIIDSIGRLALWAIA
jgi:hypothetical protein